MTDTGFDFDAAEKAPPEDPDLDEQAAEAVPVSDAVPGDITDEQITEDK